MGDNVTNNQLMLVLKAMHSDIKAVYEGHSILAQQITDLRTELKEDIALVDAKVLGLSKQVDHVEDRLSREIAEVRADLAAHRDNTECHRAPRKRVLKKVA